MTKKKDNEKKDAKNLKPNFVPMQPTPMLHQNHKLPRTRREFISQGFVAMTATAVLPTFGSMLAMQNDAFAQTAGCELPQFQGGLPYICIDGGGGMNIAGQNVIVPIVNGSQVQEDHSPSGYSSSDFIRNGITPAEHPNQPNKIEDKYGLKFHRASGILHGMNTVLDGQWMSNGQPIANGVDGIILCIRTADDTAGNPINTVYQANKAGAKGELVQLIGNQATDTGARSAADPSQINLTLRPTQVNNNNSAAGLLSLGPNLSSANYLNTTAAGGQDRIQKFMDRVAKMSKTKVEALAQKHSIAQIQQVLNCSFDNAKQLFQVYSAEQLNPANDAAVVGVFNGADQNVAAVAKLVIDKIAGAGTITIGGCDYHGNGAQATHNKDFEIGEAIGRCILLASTKNENLAIHLYTDGGVSSDAGGASQPVLTSAGTIEKVMHVGDSGTRSSQLLLVYKNNHDGSSLVKEDSNGVPRRCIGNYVKNGGVNLNTFIGNSTQAGWQVIMLNYLAAQGREAEYDNLFGIESIPSDRREELTRLKKIV